MTTKLLMPSELYYVSVFFDNNTVRTPNLFVRPTSEEAFIFANKFLMEEGFKYRKMSARKMEFVVSKEITLDFYHEVIETDHIDWTGEFNQQMVSTGEKQIPNVLTVILTGKAPGVKGTSYFLDEWYHTTDPVQAMEQMKKSNLPLFIPAKIAHLYHPTDEIHWTSWN